ERHARCVPGRHHPDAITGTGLDGEAGSDRDDRRRPLRRAGDDGADHDRADDDDHGLDRHHDRLAVTRRRVAVLMGGRSSEHAISLASAQSVVDALDPERYEVVAVEIGHDGRWTIPPGQLASGHVPKGLGRGTVPETNSSQVPVPATSNEVAMTLGEVEVVLPILHGP